LLASLDAQSLEALERQELAFRLLLQVLAKGGGVSLKDELMLLLRAAAIGELSSILPLLRACYLTFSRQYQKLPFCSCCTVSFEKLCLQDI
jgi:hypothetical protein